MTVYSGRTDVPEVLECSLFSTTVLAEIYIPIPDSQQTIRCSIPEPYQFSSDRVTPPLHTAVGSGQTIPSLPEAGVLVTSGEVGVCVCWGEDEEGRIMCPPGLKSPKQPPPPKTTNLKTLKKWADEACLDPNDPRNTKILQLLQSVPTTDGSEANVFRLHQLDSRERFVSDREFGGDRRFSLLEQRHQGHPHLQNRSIPMNKENITGSQWKAVQEYHPYKDYELPPTYQGDFHGNRREERNRFLLEVRERVLSQVRSGKKNLTIDDVIHYDIIPNISGLKNTLVELLSPRRPLKPHRKPARKPKAQNLQVSEARILVRVVRAFNVPVRKHHTDDHSPHQGPSHSVEASFSRPTSHHPAPHDDIIGTHDEGLHLISPYVEVSFGDHTQRTTTASGPSPFWNEELSLPFHPPYGDFSPSSLVKVSDSLQFNLFDELVVDLLQDDRERGTNVHQRREKKWLGSFTLPFSTLHARTKIEGSFPLEVPRLLLGYDSSTSSDGVSSDHTHLQFFVSLEPPLSPYLPSGTCSPVQKILTFSVTLTSY